jgi:hypothetical protein
MLRDAEPFYRAEDIPASREKRKPSPTGLEMVMLQNSWRPIDH